MSYNDELPSKRVQTYFGLTFAAWLVFLVILFVGISGGVWWFKVETSAIVGRGNQQIQINSAQNRTFQYTHYLQLDADIRAQATNAADARRALAEFEKMYPTPSTDNYATTQLRNQRMQNVDGAEQSCVNTVTEYNNAAQSGLSKQFLDSRLPASFSLAVCQDATLLPPSMADQLR